MIERHGLRIRTDGYGHPYKGSLLQCWPDVVDKVAQYDPNGHGEEDPDRQEAVKEAKALESRFFGGMAVIFRVCCGLLFGIFVGG